MRLGGLNLSCNTCFALAAFPVVKRPRRSLGRMSRALCALSIIAVAAGLSCREPRLRDQVRQALDATRFSVSQWSGYGRWRECPAPYTCEQVVLTGKLSRVLRRAASVEQWPTRRDGQWARATLLAATGGAYGLAESDLLDLAGESRTYEVANDLSALYLQRAMVEGPRVAAQALEWSHRALAIQPGGKEALFNRAMSYYVLELTEHASRGFLEYLQVEDDPQWRAEVKTLREEAQAKIKARRRAQREFSGLSVLSLTSADEKALSYLVRRFPMRSVEVLRSEYLSGGEGIAAEKLIEISALLEEVTRDVSIVSELLHRQTETQAYQSFGEIVESYQRLDLQVIGPLARRVRTELGGSDHPLRSWTHYYEALAEYYSGSTQSVAFEDLAAVTKRELQPVLFGHVAWMLGLLYVDRGDISAAIDQFEQGISCFVTSGLESEAAFLRLQISVVQERMGALESAWRAFGEVLENAASLVRPKRRRALWEQASRLAERSGLNLSANSFQEAAGEYEKSPILKVEAAMYRARALSRLSWSDLAQMSLGEAMASLERVQDPSVRLSLERELVAAEADVLAQTGPAGAVTGYTRALESQVGTSEKLKRLELLRKRSSALAAVGRDQESSNDVAAALEIAMSVRPTLGMDTTAVTFRSEVRYLFDPVLDRLARAGSPSALLARLDDYRAFATWHGVKHDIKGEWPRELPGQLGVFALLFTGQHLVVVFAEDGLPPSMVQWPIGRQGLKRRLEAAGRTSRSEATDWLSDKLVKPFEKRIASKTLLAFVVDDALGSVAVSSLVANGAALGASHQVARIPSLFSIESFLEWADSKRTRFQGGRVLIAGSDSWQEGHLGRLEGVSGEIEQIYEVYGEPATAEYHFEEDVTRAELVHLSNHAGWSNDDPGATTMIVGGRTVSAKDLFGLVGVEASLVFLSSCGPGASLQSDFTWHHFVNAWSNANALGVVAAPVAIDDRASQEFSVAFHELWSKSRLTALEALRITHANKPGVPLDLYWLPPRTEELTGEKQ